MADLLAIGYPTETRAAAAADEVERLAPEFGIESDSIAIIRRDREGNFHVTTNHHDVGDAASWGMFWEPLFGVLFFVPVFGMGVGSGLGTLMRKVARAGLDPEFQDQVRDLLQPGTSALFVVLEKVRPSAVTTALSRYGGTPLGSPLAKHAAAKLQHALHGVPVTM